MIKWNGPGVLYHKGRKFKAGDVIPAGILSPDRLSEFVHSGKVKVNDFTDKPVQTEQVYENGVKKLKPKKSKSEIEEDELLKAIELEELMKEEGN